MIQTNFDGNNVFLLNDEPDWSSAVESSFTVMRDKQISLTRRESRRAFSFTLLTRLTYTATTQGAALRKLLGQLRALNTQPVVVPFWPAITSWANRNVTSLNGGLRIVWKQDWSQFAIYASTDAEPGWPAAGDFFAPALMGFLTLDKSAALSRDAMGFKVDFTESSPADYALQPTAFALTNGPMPAAYTFTPPLFPFVPDRVGTAEETSVEVSRLQLGFNRDQSATFYPHTAEHSMVSSFTLDGDGTSALLDFFLNWAGPGQPFWVPSSLRCLQLAQDAADTDTILDVADTTAVLVGDYVLIYPGPVARKLIAPLTADTVKLDAAAGIPLPASRAAIFPLCLARLDKPSVKLTWLKPFTALAQLTWNELPTEVLLPGDETLGVTIGKLPTRVVLFKHTRDFRNGSTQSWYFTSFEKDIVWDGQTWKSRSYELGEIITSLNLEADSTTFDVPLADLVGALLADNPLIDEISGTAEGLLNVTIWFADFDGVNITNAAIKFTGECSEASRKGNKATVSSKFGSSVFDTNLPIFVRGPLCNHLKGTNADGSFLISAGCTLLKANWEFTALVAGPLSVDYPFTIYLTNLARTVGAAPTFFANWFALGMIVWGAGVNVQRREIVTSTNVVAGALQVNLHTYFKGVPNIGDTVKLYPGCDGLFATCKAYDGSTNATGKFANDLNFGGNPFMPVADPSTSGQPNLNQQGAKK